MFLMEMTVKLPAIGKRIRARRTDQNLPPEGYREKYARVVNGLNALRTQLENFYEVTQRQVDLLTAVTEDENADINDRIKAAVLVRSSLPYLYGRERQINNLTSEIETVQDTLDTMEWMVQEQDDRSIGLVRPDDYFKVLRNWQDRISRYIRFSALDTNRLFLQELDVPMSEVAGPRAAAAYLCDSNNFGAMACGLGLPEGIRSYKDAWYAGPDTQARLFASGTPVDGDVNRRIVRFRDGSCIVFQACEPVLTTSAASRLFVLSALLCGAAAGGAVGMLGGPVAAIGLAVAGSVGGGVAAANTRPNDVTWQGTNAQYYRKEGDKTPWGTWSFYGWLQMPSVHTAAEVGGKTNPAEFYNFADDHTRFQWFVWKSTSAPDRKKTPVYEPMPEGNDVGAVVGALKSEMNSVSKRSAPSAAPLVQALSAAVEERAVGTGAVPFVDPYFGPARNDWAGATLGSSGLM